MFASNPFKEYPDKRLREMMVKMEEIKIKARDDVRLQSFLFLPAGEGPFPSLLARCMYGADRLEEDARSWAEKGYAVVLQNVRGRHGSEGGPSGRGDYAEDGYDTMEWMVAQPWCNKRIGTFGRSAVARAQVSTAFLAHPAHRAMAPEVLPYGIGSRLGGAFMFSQIAQWLYWAQSGPELNPYEGVDWMPHLFKLPVTSVLDDLGGPLDLYREFVTDPRKNFGWSTMGHEQFKILKVPNLMVTGWYDHCATGPVDFFMQTMRYASAEQKRDTHLIVGPWDHGVDGDAAGEYDFGLEANLDHRAIQASFFAHHLRGVPLPEPLPPVKIFVMGGNVWRDEEEWPLSRARDTKFYLHSNGNVRGAWLPGRLSRDVPGDESPDRFTYDPADPVPTWGGANSAPACVLPMKRGPRDQRITLYRRDVLTYYSDPLEEPLEVTGMLKLVLFAASSSIDTDFTAKLMDVAPDGNARLLSDGVVRARFRQGLDLPKAIEPGKIYRYEIDLWFTSNEFQPGYRIGLAISSSNFPRIDRNLNTGGDNERDTEFVAADQIIFHNAEYPSHLILPVVP
jgi:predicted acyl esterase